MVVSVATRVFEVPAPRLFDRLTALRNHERLIPLTTVRAPERRPRIGDRAVATTAGLFRDEMVLIDYWRPSGATPGRARWRKMGPVLLGEAEITVTRLDGGRSLVRWYERDIHVRGLPERFLAPVLTPILRLMTQNALRRLETLMARQNAT